MKLIKTDLTDSKRLSQFLKTIPYNGPVDLILDRGEEFSKIYDLLYEDSVTYALVDHHQKIQAISSLLFKEAVVAGEKQTVGFATDLRVSHDRRAISNWAKYFLPALKTERDMRQCRYVFSVMNRYQREAYNAFIRPRSTRQTQIRYYLFRKFNLVGLHGLFPFSTKPLRHIHIRSAKHDDLPKIKDYVRKHQLQRPYYDPHFDRSLKVTSSNNSLSKIDQFILAFDRHKQIVGLLSHHSPLGIQDYTILHTPNIAQTFRQTINLLSLFGFTHKLPKTNQKLMVRHLNNIYIDNPDIFYALLRHTWSITPKNELLLYPHFESDLDTQPPLSFIPSKTPFGLYCILAPEDPIPDFLKPVYLGKPPDYDGILF